MPDPKTFDVPVAGGSLRAAVWGAEEADGGAGKPVVLCSHGLTANHVSFLALAEALGPGVRMVACDHRGRGRSRDVGAPFGMAAHADDLVAVLDHFGIERADVILGHSMGGFVAAVTRARHETRVGHTILVDGGLPLLDSIPPGMDLEALVQGIVGPAMDRLDMTFPSREAYREFWRNHPAFGNEWSPWVERYLDYDLTGEPPALHATTRKEAVLGDTQSQLVDDTIPSALASLRGPVRFLRAPRGIMNAEPLYDEARLASWAEKIDGFTFTTVPDVNHYTILIGDRGARAVAAEVRRLCPR